MSKLSQRTQSILNRALQIIVLVYQAVAVLVFVSTLYLATDWLRNPFLGGLFEHTFVLNGANTSEDGQSWAMYTQGFSVGDQLISVDGMPVTTAGQLKGILGSHMAGDQVTVEMRTTAGAVEKTAITLQEFPEADRFVFFYIPRLLIPRFFRYDLIHIFNGRQHLFPLAERLQ